MNQEQKDRIASALGIPKDEQTVLDGGARHPYSCKCVVCLDWWVLMGPENPSWQEEGDEPTYGPFTPAEVDAAKHRGARRYDSL